MVVGVLKVGMTALVSLIVRMPVVARMFSSGWALNTL